MPLISCTQCLASINVDPGVDPHSLTWCNCCTAGHHHAEGNAECALDDSHQCWHGPQDGPRPEGCAVCRPIVHHVEANIVLGG